ncbi:MAG: PHP domain protein [bacterium ADurb.Bin429]|nr:MAG: PHP domain protein [bacterium ADurb.Bin429]
MEKGDGTMPSDLHTLLDNLYRWLAQGSLPVGMGGYDAAGGVKPSAPQPLEPGFMLADVWAKRDPTMQGKATRPMRVLVGAHSAMSDGAGTPAEWAAAAKAAGYDVICFTESLEKTDIDRWAAFVEACAAASDSRVALLPGLDMGTDLDDRFLVVGHTGRIRTHLLTDDRKQLFWTGHLLLGMGDVLPIAARPARLAQNRQKGALPPDLYSHVSGVAVATYRDGKLVDDGMFAYQWLTDNASLPIPVAVHEVFAPTELQTAVKIGLQNYVNADTPINAADFYRQGMASFGGNPARRYLSSGPLIDDCRIDNWQSPTWNVTLEAHSAQPITTVAVRDQYGVYRQFAPLAPAASVTWSGNLGIQRWFLIEVTDAKGGKALLSPMRTLPRLNTIRCMDRQNWFTPLPWNDMVYTGRANRTSSGSSISVPGVTVNGPYVPKFQVIYSGEGYYIHEFTSDSTYVPGGRDPGADNSPIFHDVPIPEFAGRTRYISFMAGRSVQFRQYITTVTLKRDLPMKAPVWPVFTRAKGNAYVYNDPKTGQRMEGTITKEGFIDLPVGGVAGNLLALTPLRVMGDGTAGLACDTEGTLAKTGVAFTGSYLLIDAKKAAEVRNALGFDGATPFSLALTQGKHDGTALYISLTAKSYGAAGHVTGGTMPVLGMMPIRLTGANPRWPLGLWQPSAEPATPGVITNYDFLDGVGLGRLNVTANGDFYLGNLLTAGNPNLHLAFSTPWTQEGATIEVNNPTEKAIRTTISSPKAIKDRLVIRENVSVPAGATIFIKVGK